MTSLMDELRERHFNLLEFVAEADADPIQAAERIEALTNDFHQKGDRLGDEADRIELKGYLTYWQNVYPGYHERAEAARELQAAPTPEEDPEPETMRGGIRLFSGSENIPRLGATKSGIRIRRAAMNQVPHTLAKFDPTRPVENPYPGLRPFRTEEAGRFCGRSVELKAVERWLAFSDTRPLILTGPTGIGKTSFLRAMVLPSLTRKSITVEGPQVLRTGEELAEWITAIENARNSGVRKAAVLIVEIAEPSRQCWSAEQVQQFWETLHTLRDGKTYGKALVVAPAESRVLLEWPERQTAVDLLKMQAASEQSEDPPAEEPCLLTLNVLTSEELAEAIERPARAVGLVWYGDTVSRMVAELTGLAGNPVLLQWLLRRIFFPQDRIETKTAEPGTGSLPASCVYPDEVMACLPLTRTLREDAEAAYDTVRLQFTEREDDLRDALLCLFDQDQPDAPDTDAGQALRQAFVRANLLRPARDADESPENTDTTPDATELLPNHPAFPTVWPYLDLTIKTAKVEARERAAQRKAEIESAERELATARADAAEARERAIHQEKEIERKERELATARADAAEERERAAQRATEIERQERELATARADAADARRRLLERLLEQYAETVENVDKSLKYLTPVRYLTMLTIVTLVLAILFSNYLHAVVIVLVILGAPVVAIVCALLSGTMLQRFGQQVRERKVEVDKELDDAKKSAQSLVEVPSAE